MKSMQYETKMADGLFRLLLISGLAFMGIEAGCPYDFSVASRMIPSACYDNSTEIMVGKEACCWYAYASFIFAVSQYANQTGAVFLEAAGSSRCTDDFVAYVQGGGLVPSTFFVVNSTACSIDPLTFKVNQGPCRYASLNEIWSTIDLHNASRACDGPNLNVSDACGKCQGEVENDAIRLLNITNSKEFVPCGMAVTVGLWGRNPSESAFLGFVGCIMQVLEDIGNLGTSDLVPSPPASDSDGSSHSNGKWRRRVRIGVSAGVGLAGFIAVAVMAWIIALKIKKLRHSGNSTSGSSLQASTLSLTGRKSPPPPLPTEGLYIFTHRELRVATGGFDPGRVLGQGGSGKVYLGTLPSGQMVAIKRVVKAKKVPQFYQEVELLSRLRHPNLTALLGYCLHRRDHMLVYEYMAGGDLGSLLYSPAGTAVPALPWERRLQIALDCAEGLAYLHLLPEGSIVHRDIKPTNILLNEDGQAKLADFGVSKLVSPNFTHVSTEIKGTTGYLDPEYFSVGHLTEASDVYSFGVVLLELVTGQRAVINTPSGGAESIVYATHVFMSGEDLDVRNIMDPRIANDVEGHMEAVKVVVDVAYRCVMPYRVERPSILDVLGVLREAWKRPRLRRPVLHKPCESCGKRQI